MASNARYRTSGLVIVRPVEVGNDCMRITSLLYEAHLSITCSSLEDELQLRHDACNIIPLYVSRSPKNTLARGKEDNNGQKAGVQNDDSGPNPVIYTLLTIQNALYIYRSQHLCTRSSH